MLTRVLFKQPIVCRKETRVISRGEVISITRKVAQGDIKISTFFVCAVNLLSNINLYANSEKDVSVTTVAYYG